MTTESTPKILHAATCRKCGIALVLEQDPECPPLRVPHWISMIVCNRCGKYCERLRAIDDAIANIGARWQVASTMKDAVSARAVMFDALRKQTQALNRLLTEHWQTTADWSEEFVDLLLDKPDRTRIAVRMEETNHRQARDRADREAAKQRKLEL